MLLTGTFVRALDEKQRFAIPRIVREPLGFPTSRVVYLTPGTDRSLDLYPEEAFSKLAAQLDHGSPTRADVRAFSRMFYAQAQRVEMDRQARVRIPPELFALGSLSKEIVLLGVRDHMEIWDREHWEMYLGQKQAHFDEIAEAAFSEERRGEAKTIDVATDTGARPVQPR